jgi:hypothetical protein
MGCDSLTVEHRPAQSRMATPPVVRIFGVTTAKSRMRWLKSRRLPKNPEEIAIYFCLGNSWQEMSGLLSLGLVLSVSPVSRRSG